MFVGHMFWTLHHNAGVGLYNYTTAPQCKIKVRLSKYNNGTRAQNMTFWYIWKTSSSAVAESRTRHQHVEIGCCEGVGQFGAKY